MSNIRLMSDEIKGKELLFRLATNQKFQGSIIDGVMEIVHGHNPTGMAMVLG